MAEKEKHKSLDETEREIAEVELQTKHDQAEIARVDLQTKKLGLAEAKARNANFQQAEDSRHKGNRQRQAEIAQTRSNVQARQKQCRHKAGGQAGGDELRGGGKFAHSVLTRAIMPDGHTELLQCSHCDLMLYGRELTPAEIAKLAALDAADEASGIPFRRVADHEEWTRLRQVAIEDGIPNNVLRGPTFIFQDANGVNFIPERV